MIRSFQDPRTARIFRGEIVKGVSHDMLRRARAKLLVLDRAGTLADLAGIPGNRLEPLRGDRAGSYSIRLNAQWRLCFRWAENEAFDVEFVD